MKVFLERKHCLSQTELVAYLKETCSEEELHAIETHLLDCELCASAVEGYGSMYDVATETPQLKDWSVVAPQLMSRVAPEQVTEKSSVKSSLWGFNQIAAAAVMLLISLGSFLYWQHTTTERRYQRYAQSFDFTQEGFSYRGTHEQPTKYAALTAAIKKFNDRAYDESLRSTKALLETEPENLVASFYAGISALKLARTGEAIHYLSICRINSDRYYEDASWYLALAHLKAGAEEEAELILQELKGVEDGYYEEAVRSLLAELQAQ